MPSYAHINHITLYQSAWSKWNKLTPACELRPDLSGRTQVCPSESSIAERHGREGRGQQDGDAISEFESPGRGVPGDVSVRNRERGSGLWFEGALDVESRQRSDDDVVNAGDDWLREYEEEFVDADNGRDHLSARSGHCRVADAETVNASLNGNTIPIKQTVVLTPGYRRSPLRRRSER